MSFGNGYQQQEYGQIVPEGDYFVRLGMPQDIERNGYRIRSIPVEYRGHPGFGPKTWEIFDAPEGDADRMQKWNEQRTRDADAFGVQRGDFRPEAWRGKTGWVHVGKNKKGYMNILWSVIKKDASSNPASSSRPMQEGKDYPPLKGSTPPASAAPAFSGGVSKQDEFEDDVPSDW